MKKISALLLILLVIVSCVGCTPRTENPQETTAHTHTQQNTDDVSAQETTSVQSSVHSSTVQTTPPASQSEQTNPSKETEPEENTVPAETKPEQNTAKNLYRGTVSNNTYKSSTTNITFTKPSDWRFLSDEELALKIGIDAMELKDYVFPTTADRVPAVYDMWATDPKTGVNISVAYENMYVTASVAMTTDEYLEMLEGAFENTKGTELLSKDTVKLSGQTYRKAVFKTENGGTSSQSIYYLRGMGKFMNIVLVTVPAGANIPDTEKMFG